MLGLVNTRYRGKVTTKILARLDGQPYSVRKWHVSSLGVDLPLVYVDGYRMAVEAANNDRRRAFQVA